MAPHVDSYEFGSITIDGASYRRDVVVLPEGVRPDWWRKEGHGLHPDDLAPFMEPRPEVVVIGCGTSGMLRVPNETREWLARQGIDLVALPTGEACERYNELAAGKRVLAGLHLTC